MFANPPGIQMKRDVVPEELNLDIARTVNEVHKRKPTARAVVDDDEELVVPRAVTAQTGNKTPPAASPVANAAPASSSSAPGTCTFQQSTTHNYTRTTYGAQVAMAAVAACPAGGSMCMATADYATGMTMSTGSTLGTSQSVSVSHGTSSSNGTSHGTSNSTDQSHTSGQSNEVGGSVSTDIGFFGLGAKVSASYSHGWSSSDTSGSSASQDESESHDTSVSTDISTSSDQSSSYSKEWGTSTTLSQSTSLSYDAGTSGFPSFMPKQICKLFFCPESI
jgi:hypothetical protein